MGVTVAVGMGANVGSGLGVAVAVGMDVAVAVGKGVSVGVFVGKGVAVAVGSSVGIAVAVGMNVDVGSGLGVAVGGGCVGIAVGVTVTPWRDAMNGSTVRVGLGILTARGISFITLGSLEQPTAIARSRATRIGKSHIRIFTSCGLMN